MSDSATETTTVTLPEEAVIAAAGALLGAVAYFDELGADEETAGEPWARAGTALFDAAGWEEERLESVADDEAYEQNARRVETWALANEMAAAAIEANPDLALAVRRQAEQRSQHEAETERLTTKLRRGAAAMREAGTINPREVDRV